MGQDKYNDVACAHNITSADMNNKMSNAGTLGAPTKPNKVVDLRCNHGAMKAASPFVRLRCTCATSGFLLPGVHTASFTGRCWTLTNISTMSTRNKGAVLLLLLPPCLMCSTAGAPGWRTCSL
uniref:Uncharacterized protein n=1 Tax=Eutreptiella gymnastica TaxID=73025 RepID=A0A7S4LLZ8_9EUGL